LITKLNIWLIKKETFISGVIIKYDKKYMILAILIL